jgi:hypothetical protein
MISAIAVIFLWGFSKRTATTLTDESPENVAVAEKSEVP